MGGGIDQSVSPGMGGFLAFFLLACALWLLMRNMLKHMRAATYREDREEEARLAREAAAQTTGSQTAGSPVAGSPGVDAGGAARDAAADDVQTRPSSLSAGYPREPQA